MNKQKMFDRVSAHLLTQKSKALNDEGDCKYRCEDGRSCAIGCLISESEYDKGFEGETIVSSQQVLRAVRESTGEDITSQDIAFLRALQTIHDDFGVDKWKGQLTLLAKDNGLSIEALTL